MLRSYRTYQNDYSWELVQPGGRLVFVTRQAQSKIDKVLQSSSRAMADILRPFSKLQEKNSSKQLDLLPGLNRIQLGQQSKQATPILPNFFSPIRRYQSSTCQPPHTPGQRAPLFFIQVCAVLVEIRVVPSLVLPLQTLQYSPGAVRQSGLF